MPGKVKVKILAGRNLPVMDRSSDTTDAYVEIKLGNTTYKTDVCRKSLNPTWDSEWYRYEVDDSELQDEPLQIRLMDHDTYSANDSIGKVYLDLNPLLLPVSPSGTRGASNSDGPPSSGATPGNVFSGWIPVFDTMHGIRGEVHIIVKVELFSDFNKFRQSSCGVQFFCSPAIPCGYHAQVIHGFVEELVVNDDPEYQWIDKIRTPRASNEARQTLFFKLSGEVQRKIGLKALELGGNAVIGYHQCFDLEGESGIVVRGIGTAVTLQKMQEPLLPPSAHLDGPPAEDMSPADAVDGFVEAVAPGSASRRASPVPVRDSTSESEDDSPARAPIPRMGAALRRIAARMKVRRLSWGSTAAAAAAGDGAARHPRPLRPAFRPFRLLPPPSALSRRLGALRRRLAAPPPPLPPPSRAGSESRPRSCSDARPSARRLRGHGRSASDCAPGPAPAGPLARVPEVRESPGSSPPSPPKPKPRPPPDLLPLPRSPAPQLRYVDGHLVSNASSGASSSCSSSESSTDASDALTPPPPRRSSVAGLCGLPAFADFAVRRRLPRSCESVNSVFTTSDASGAPSPNDAPAAPAAPAFPAPRPGVPALEVTLHTPVDEIPPFVHKPPQVQSPLTPPPTPPRTPLSPPSIPSFRGDPCSPSPTLLSLSPKSPKTTNSPLSPKPVKSPTPTLLSLSSRSPRSSASPKSPVSPRSPFHSPRSLSPGPRTPPPSPKSPRSKHSPHPLHKSRSAASLQSRSPHATNALRHGPCLLPPSREAPADEGGGPERPPASPPPPHGLPGVPGARVSPSPAKLCSLPAVGGLGRRSSDSDLSITPKGNSLTGSDRSSTAGPPRPPPARPALTQESVDMLEYPFLTMSKYPPGFILQIGGYVSARSVKLLERMTNIEEPESRDAWWTELRMEVRSHARALCCNVVLGYRETSSICEDVCVLSASGSAAVVALGGEPEPGVLGAASRAAVAAGVAAGAPSPAGPVTTPGQQQPATATATPAPLSALACAAAPDLPPQPERATPQRLPTPAAPVPTPAHAVDASQPPLLHGRRLDAGAGAGVGCGSGGDAEAAAAEARAACAPTHLPYRHSSVPFRAGAVRCSVCRKAKVPDVLYTTVEPPEGLAVVGKGGLVYAAVCRPKRDLRGELNAKDISDGLPFLEYDLHRALTHKLRLLGMNAIFGLNVQVTVGERLMVALATGTACYLAALPPPPVPTVAAGNSWTDEKALAGTQRTLHDAVRRAREFYGLPPVPAPGPAPARPLPAVAGALDDADDTNESEEEAPELDLKLGNKGACIIEVDDAEDMEQAAALAEAPPPEGFLACTTETPPGLDEAELAPGVQMFTHVWRARLPARLQRALHAHVQRLMRGLFFKLRRAAPTALARLRFRVELPEPDEIQISVLGMALSIVPPPARVRRKIMASSVSRELLSARRDESDLIFSLEEDQVAEAAPSPPPPVHSTASAVATTSSAPRTAHAPSASTSSGVSSTASVPPTSTATAAPAVSSSSGVSSHAASATAATAGSLIRPVLRGTHRTVLGSQPQPRLRFGIDVSPLSWTPAGRVERYLGNLNFFFVRESTSLREAGGLSGFMHAFMCEVLAIVRSHVTALGGNAMAAYFMSECVLYHNPHKNQGQCLINVGGDVVWVAYDD